jgi:Ca2+-binding EF-hand superfamily protein
MEVEFLPVYVPNDEEKSNPALYAHNVRQVMAKAMGVACTNHAYEDVALLMQNEFLRQYTNDHIILTTNVTEISSLTCLYGQDVEKLIHFFIQRDRNLDGHLSFDEFVHLFPNDSKLLLHHLFHLLDLDGNGLIDFREFCLAIGMLSRPTIPHDPTTTGPGILHTYRPMTTTGINSSSNIDDQEENQMIDFAFRLYDLNENGSLEVKELEKMLDFVFTFHSTSLIEKTNPQQILASLLIEEEEQEHHQPSTTAASTTGTAATSGTTATSSITSTTTRQISYQTFKKCIQKRPYLLSGPIQRLELLRGFQPVDIKKPHRNTIIT